LPLCPLNLDVCLTLCVLLHHQDEVLSHRLGLVPLNVHPDTLQWRSTEDAINQDNTLVLRLALACTRKPGVGLGAGAGPGVKDEDLVNGRGECVG
jgi:hypothetical protein